MRPQIAVIGDSEVNKDSLKHTLAKNLGRALVDYGYRIVSGAWVVSFRRPLKT